MTKDVLLEIGLEEIPAKYVSSSVQQLKNRIEHFFKENQIEFEQIATYATPRRLSVIVKNVSEKQNDSVLIFKGPSKKIAQDSEGNWTKAAIGFVKGQEMSVEDIYFEKIKDIDYIHIKKEVKGQETSLILPQLKDIILSMTFPISMTWGSHKLRYIRPIHWIIALFGEKVIPFDILGVQTGKISRGHRFLGKNTQIDSTDDYVENLKNQYVIVDQQERKQMIVSQIETLAKENNWIIDIDESLLEEVTNIVEYPTAFYGKFDEKYLEIADEVLITTMKEHQRYFYVKDENNQLLPYFISVRNGNDKFLEEVIKGNEKVLIARLEDALFFTKEDAKINIADAVEKLKSVNYHVKIGSVYDKMMRVKEVVKVISQQLNIDSTIITNTLRASEIYKFDLMTNIVSEFPELQGIIGEKYAINFGENKKVAQAIKEHYLPIGLDSKLPESIEGAILAVSDKLDALISFFNADMIPSGSNDPYALRRQAIGIVQIFEKFNWQIDFDHLIDCLLSQIYHSHNENLFEQVNQFISARLSQRLSMYDIKHDIIEASLGVNKFKIPNIIDNAKDLQAFSKHNQYKLTIEAISRVINLSRKSVEITDFEIKDIDSTLFLTQSETNLFNVLNQLNPKIDAFQLLLLEEPISKFFDENMVLVDDVAIRNNRLNLLLEISRKVLEYADTTKLVIK